MSDVLATLRERVAPFRLPVGVVGAALMVVGSLTPWATFFFGYPGKVTLAGFPGGARLYPLLLAATVLLLFVDLPGRRRAGLVASLGALAIVVGNILAIARDGGGFGAVAYGAWLCLTGCALLALALLGLPDDRPVPTSFAPLPAAVELVIIAASLGLMLAAVVVSLLIEESSWFISFVAFVGVASAAIQRVGGFARLNSLFIRHRNITLAAAAITAVAFPFTQDGSSYWLRVFASIGVFAAAAIGLNVVVGLAGLLDLGYIAFFGVGAYVGALMGSAARTTYDGNWPFILVALVGATVAAVFGVVIGAPTLRLRGDYLAIVTLGFGEIFRIAVNNMDGLTRGPNGIAGVPDLAVGSFNFGDTHELFGFTLPGFANYFYVEMILVALAILIFTRLNDSRIGRAWVAIREDETAAAAMGIDTVRMKLLAFAIGAFIAGAAGAVNAHVAASAAPDSFTFLESILLLAAVVLGGMGTVPGAILGSAALFIIPEKLRAFQDKRLLLFGLALILMMRFRPEGIVPSRRRQAELHADSGDQGDAMSAPPGAPVSQGELDVTVLEARGVTKIFGGLTAVNGVDLQVNDGEIVGLIGPNGAGKTTFFNCLTGMEEPTAGEITYRGKRLSGKPHSVTASGLARTFQNIRLFPNMTALENVLVGRHCRTKEGVFSAIGRGRGYRREERESAERARELLAFVGLTRSEDSLARNLPYGDQRRLEIARALATEPGLLLLDEPTAGMNPQETAAAMQLVRRVRDQGLAVVVIEHDMKFIFNLCDRVAVLVQGAKLVEGTPAEVQSDARVVEAYLGAPVEP